MTDRLAELAIASLDDPDAAVVLGDFVLENKWYDERVMPLARRWRAGTNDIETSKQERVFYMMAARGDADLARAIAAVVLFGEWPEATEAERFWHDRAYWPVVARCSYRVKSLAAQFLQIQDLLEQNLITREQALAALDAPDIQPASSSGSGRR